MKCAPRACAFLFFILHLNTISLITIDKKIVFETLSRCVCSSYPTHKRNENHKPTLVCTQQHIFLRLLTYMQIGTQETVEKNMVCKTSFDAPSVYPMNSCHLLQNQTPPSKRGFEKFFFQKALQNNPSNLKGNSFRGHLGLKFCQILHSKVLRFNI